jgi:hypothetical protein
LFCNKLFKPPTSQLENGGVHFARFELKINCGAPEKSNEFSQARRGAKRLPAQ